MKDVEDYIKQGISEQNDIFQSFNFKLEEVEGFRYRAKDAWRAVTKIAVREARLKEIKYEMLNSKKLKVKYYIILIFNVYSTVFSYFNNS